MENNNEQFVNIDGSPSKFILSQSKNGITTGYQIHGPGDYSFVALDDMGNMTTITDSDLIKGEDKAIEALKGKVSKITEENKKKINEGILDYQKAIADGVALGIKQANPSKQNPTKIALSQALTDQKQIDCNQSERTPRVTISRPTDKTKGNSIFKQAIQNSLNDLK